MHPPHSHLALIRRTSTDIVRLLFMVPIYASISFASYLFWVRRDAGSHSVVLTHKTDRITPPLSSSSETATKASSSPHSFISCSPTFLRTRTNKRKSFASTEYLTRMTANARGKVKNLSDGCSLSGLSSPSQRWVAPFNHLANPVESIVRMDCIFFRS